MNSKNYRNMRRKLIAAVVLTVFTAMLFSACAFELVDEEGGNYEEYFEKKVSNYTVTLLPTLSVDNYQMPIATYLNNDDSDAFYVEKENGYGSKCYSFIVVTVAKACVLDEIVMYVKWDKANSGAAATARLEVQLFKVPGTESILSLSWLKDTLMAEAKGEADEMDLFKTEPDATMPLKEGKWNDGVLLSLKGFTMAAGDRVIIKFPQNCDFSYTYDDSAEGEEQDKYSYTPATENDVCFMLDKLMFHLA